MTHIALARKWRPKGFASLVGQEHVVRALVHSLEQNRLHHAYLFTGTRGVGKTTLSRILAKALNCEKGITATPCGTCRACLEVEAGHCIDYIEMDAASNRGVEEMTALLEQAVYAPVVARFKVYMIDEVHMLTQHAFNAMLKTLEEPPPHVKFILATTDPKKVPVTVLSRCLQFNLKQLSTVQIAAHLEEILRTEQIQFTTKALPILARLAQGSLRDALSLTDQAIAYSAGVVSEAALQQMFGTLDQKYLGDLLKNVAAGQGAAVLQMADEMATRGASFGAALQDLASLLHRIAWVQYAPSALNQMAPDAEEIQHLANLLDPEQVQLYYQIATVGRSELGLAPDEYAGFTMTLLRMLAFYPSSEGIEQTSIRTKPASHDPKAQDNRFRVAAPVDREVLQDSTKFSPSAQQEGASQSQMKPRPSIATASMAQKNEHAPAQAVAPALLEKDVLARTASSAPLLEPAPMPFESKAGPFTHAIAQAVPTKNQSIPQNNVSKPEVEPPLSGGIEMPIASPKSASLELLQDTAQWPGFVPTLRLKGLTEQLAAHSELIQIQGTTLTLRVLVPLAQTHCVEKLEMALSEYFGQTLTIKTEIGVAMRTAAQDSAKAHSQRQEEALESMQNNVVVQDLQRLFDANLVPGSVRAI